MTDQPGTVICPICVGALGETEGCPSCEQHLAARRRVDAGTPTPDAAIAKHRSGQRLNLMETAALIAEAEQLQAQRQAALDLCETYRIYRTIPEWRLRAALGAE